MGKTTILFQCSDEFKDAVGRRANKDGIGSSELIRRAVAAYIEYDLTTEPVVDGRRKYANAEERYEEQKKRQKADRSLTARLVAAIEKEQKLQDILGIEKSLLAKGVDLNED